MNPTASVIIATCCRPDLLARCLRQLDPAIQTASHNNTPYEVIVVDDDPARSAASIVLSDFPWVRLAYGRSTGPAAARNIGAGLARGQYLLFTDDDCVPTFGWIVGYLEGFTANPTAVLYGPTTCLEGCRDVFDHAPENAEGKYTFGCNLAASAETFRAIGGFDERLEYRYSFGFEDYDFFDCAKEKNSGVVYEPHATVDHPPRKLSPALKRARALKNYFIYLLKHRQEPRLTIALRHLLAAWRHRLLRKAAPMRWLQGFSSCWAEIILTLAYFDRLRAEAQKVLDQHP